MPRRSSSISTRTSPRSSTRSPRGRSLQHISSPSFADLGIDPALVAALAAGGVHTPFPVQTMTIPDALSGRDIAGRAPTGSGKTLAFGIPIIQRLQRGEPLRPRALVLAPTRELARQIADALAPIARARRLRVHAFYGGVPFEPQIAALARGVDIAVACPGRLLDLVGQGLASLGDVEVAVVDEADRLADMGFLPDVRRLLDMTRADRQTMLFSATLDGDVDTLVADHQRDPVHHEVVPPEQGPIQHHFWLVDEHRRTELVADIAEQVGSCVVFAGTRHGAERLAVRLHSLGIAAASLHGGNSQLKREAALDAFRRAELTTLVATDVAARGIHVDDVACVVHHDLPTDPKDFIHRSGRTGRAGSIGMVVALVKPAQRELALRIIEAAGIEADIVPADIARLETDDDRAAYDRELAALAEERRPGAVGTIRYRFTR